MGGGVENVTQDGLKIPELEPHFSSSKAAECYSDYLSASTLWCRADDDNKENLVNNVLRECGQ